MLEIFYRNNQKPGHRAGLFRSSLKVSDDNAYTIVAAAKKVGTGSWTVYNIFCDHLGTITHLKTGSAITEYSFDAWGRRRDKDDWTYTLTGEPALFADRGFTAHEYLADFNLYNMNGRMYDPVVGRFLSPDPYVQAPDFTQSFNRYSYCLNNPLIYIDPSGYKWRWGNPFYHFQKFMQWVNDNTTKLREKMAEAGIPDFGVGVSINGGTAVPFVSVPVSPGTDVSVGYNTSTGKVGIGNNSSGFQQFYYPSANHDPSVNNAMRNIEEARQVYFTETSQNRGNKFDGVSWGTTFAFSSPFSSNRSPIDSGGYGISFGRFTGTNTRGIYFTTMKGEGVMLSLSLDVTYYNNWIGENLELNRIKGYGTMIDVGVGFGGYSRSSDGFSQLNQTPTYTGHTLSLGWGMDVGYTQWKTKTYVLPTLPWIGLLVPRY